MSTTQLTFIYALIDPRTNCVRYVGKAKDPLKRLGFHLCDSQLKPNTHRNHWLRSLKTIGLMPRQIILEAVSFDADWREAERYWIAHYGDELTNGTSGGDGLNNPSAATREKCGSSRRGKKFVFTQKHKDKIAAANRARAKDPVWLETARANLAKHRNMKGHVWSDEERKSRTKCLQPN